MDARPGYTDHVFVELDVRETSIDKIEWRSVFTVTGYNILDPQNRSDFHVQNIAL